jgi:cell migration-inducing and hyaluronan-binding protein
MNLAGCVTVSIFLSLILLSSSIQAQMLWSNPSTWPSGSVPVEGEMVTIDFGTEVILDVSPPPLGGVMIYGTLRFAELPLHLTTDWIIVLAGKLEIGTEAAPHMNDARITLTGEDEEVLGLGVGGKCLALMAGGVADLHGIRRDDVPWTQLSSTAEMGTSTIHLVDSVNWRVGDEIVIAPSGINPFEAEVFHIESVSSDGKSIRLDRTLLFEHYGEIQMVEGKALDMRAEVGLLTRNIVVEGDASSDSTQFGGHMMVAMSGDAYVEGVEFFRMGQRGKQGRYPLHWHLTGDKYDNYARRNSVHQSFHRAYVIHGTNGVSLIGNVGYDVNSHMYVVAEDGNEQYNIVQNNLGILAKRLRAEYFAFPSTLIVGGTSQAEHRPGVFWMKNPNQIFLNNHAAGSMDGSGFFFDGVGTAESIPHNFFRGNLAHSNYSEFEIYDNDRYPPRTRGHGLFIREDIVEGAEYHFDQFTAYKNMLAGMWLEEEGQYADGAMLADNGMGFFTMRGSFTNATVLYRSENEVQPPTKDYGAINSQAGFGKKKAYQFDGLKVIDFPSPIILFEDSLIGPELSMRNVQAINHSGVPVQYTTPKVSGAIRDEDGSLTGKEEPSLVFHETYPFALPDCEDFPATNSTVCPMDRYHFLTFSSEVGSTRPIGEMSVKPANAGSRTPLFTYENYSDYVKYQYLPKNKNYLVKFEYVDSIPSYFTIENEGESEGYLAFRLDFPASTVGYFINEYDEIVDPVDNLSDLQLDRTNYYIDHENFSIYIVLYVDATTNYHESVNVIRVPAGSATRDAEMLNTMQVWPRIVQNQVTVSWEQSGLTTKSEPLSIELFDASGQMVDLLWQGNVEQQRQQWSFEMNNLPAGMYFIQSRQGTSKMVEKIIVN